MQNYTDVKNANWKTEWNNHIDNGKKVSKIIWMTRTILVPKP